MKTLQRIGYIILQSSTEYAEFLLGVISLLTGFWLVLPFCRSHFAASSISSCVKPEIWGALLLFSGAAKFIGVLRTKLGLRQASCFIAMFVWWFVALILASGDDAWSCAQGCPLTPMMAVMGLFNALIYIKLRLVSK